MFKLIFLFAPLLFQNIHGSTENCPDPHPMIQKFDIDKFLGHWYVVEKNHGSDPCQAYNIEKYEDPEGHRQFEMKEVVPSNHNNRRYFPHYLTVPDSAAPAKMEFDSPFNSNLIVFMTDYDNYGIAIKCVHFSGNNSHWDINILSRTPSLSPLYTITSRTMLRMKNIDYSTHESVSHEGCPKVDFNASQFL